MITIGAVFVRLVHLHRRVTLRHASQRLCRPPGPRWCPANDRMWDRAAARGRAGTSRRRVVGDLAQDVAEGAVALRPDLLLPVLLEGGDRLVHVFDYLVA